MTSISTNKRLEQIKDHITGNSSSKERLIYHRHPDDVVIVSAVRTPICRAGKGGLKDMYPEDMLAVVLRAAAERAKIDPKLVNDIQTGNVLQELGGIKVGRAAMFSAGFSYTTSYANLNRQCASGLQACNYIANAIRAGEIDIGIGAGVESMSNDYGSKSQPSRVSAAIKTAPGASDCFVPMGITSENVAADFSITRQEQDQFAVESHEKALRAQALGLFDDEIVPVHVQQTVTVKNEHGQEEKTTRNVVISKDEGPRAGSTVEKLGKLKAVFKKDGSTTAGNASQVSDGAAAVVLMRRNKAIELGCTILGRWCASRVVGVPPRIMGVGPAFAIPAVLKDVGLSVDDVDVYEINEAFASQALYCVRTLGINPAKVNPKGGAIALGHPLGMTGARQIATLMPHLKATGQAIGVVSMCMGAGMLVSKFACLTSKKNHEEALRILKRVATMVKPIMKAHNWKIGTLAEFYRSGLLGMNTNKGAKIELCLRKHDNENEFLPWQEIIGTMLHELAHNIRGPHDAQFYKAFDDLYDEYDKVVDSGYTGEGFDASGHRLGTNGLSGRFGARGNCLGGGQAKSDAGALVGSNAMAAAAAAAEKRRQVNELMLPPGGRRLGSGTTGSGTYSDKKFWEQRHSPGELAAMAAERRAKDKIWCGSESSGGSSSTSSSGGDGSGPSSPSVQSGSHAGLQPSSAISAMDAKAKKNDSSASSTKGLVRKGSSEQHIPIPSSSKRKASLNVIDLTALDELEGKNKGNGRLSLRQTEKKPKSDAGQMTPQDDNGTSEWTTWTCPSCTLINQALALQCDCCLAVRP
ncbi:hypothetical protein BGZ94_003642 [Podila epigama]|nr:hypothetical protein BGZ94_003642 [Podila epigama]